MHFDLGVYANRRVWARELRSTALEASSPRAGRDGSQTLAGRACRAQLEGIGRADGGSGKFSGIDATRAQIVQG